jgi:hypothetical protein
MPPIGHHSRTSSAGAVGLLAMLLAWGALPAHTGEASAERPSSLPSSEMPAQDDPPLRILGVRLDPPTLHTLGVQMLIAGDTNRNAAVGVRYRPAGSTVWRQGPPLFRVFPKTVTVPVPAQFAGSIFDLVPGTVYQIELHAVDPDLPADQIRFLVGRTRRVPRDNPLHPREIVVTSASSFVGLEGSGNLHPLGRRFWTKP